jgi:GT2 family glycosyltransferase
MEYCLDDLSNPLEVHAMNKVAVVIPSYEDSTRLRRCLLSIEKHLAAIDHEVVVVDNASEKPEVIRLLSELETDTNVRVVRNSANLGFAKAVNRGIAVLKSHSRSVDFVLVLNQDASLMDAHIHTALDLMDQNPRIGLCGPRLHNGDETLQNSFYAFPSPIKKIAQLLGLKKVGSIVKNTGLSPRLVLLPSFASYYLWNYSKSTAPIEVPWITGACLLIRKKAFDGLSGFDEHIWMYAEDMDFCFRAREMGWASVFFPDWHVCHYGGKPPALISEDRIRLYHGSLSYFYAKHFRGVKKTCMLVLNKLEETKSLKSWRDANRQDD